MTDTTATFTDFGVEEVLADALASRGIVHPFPIQELALPMALKGADVIGQARTGTGKTLAFGLPLIQRIDPGRKQTQALVVVPTRELCLQVADDLTIGNLLGVSSIAVYGGVGYDEQIDALRGGVHVVVGTPGRTLDHLQRGNLDLSGVHTVVIDEADEMLDMGFLPDVERLMTAVPEQRQTLLFSATMPTVIVKLARRFMSSPTFMRAESQERETAPTVEQHFLMVHRMDKPRVLARLLQTDDRGGAFVFTRTKNMADRLVRELEDLHVKAISVHGDLRQSTRERNLDRFRAGKADVLVATEVAARGLDVDNVTHVVNYDCPDDEKMYLHRIGRTARAGNRGVAVTFAEFNEVDRLNVIRKAVQAPDDILEVFSTSPALTELFDLPDETPWDHMARIGGRGSRPARSSGGRDGRRRSSSDGRNKSRSDGSRPASRDRPRAEAPGKDDTAATPSGGGTRQRTRTRSRSRGRTAEQPAETSGETSRETSGSNGSRKGCGDPGRSGEDRGKGSDKRPRARTSRSSSGKDQREPASHDRSGSGASSRGSTNRGGGRNRGSDSDRRSETTSTAGKGAAARGDGTPRPRRRVRVDHLP